MLDRLNGRLAGKQIEQLWRDPTVELPGFKCSQNHWHTEHLRRLCQHQHVLEQVLPVRVGRAEEHLRLVINEDNRAILGRQQPLVGRTHAHDILVLNARITGRTWLLAPSGAIDQVGAFFLCEGTRRLYYFWTRDNRRRRALHCPQH